MKEPRVGVAQSLQVTPVHEAVVAGVAAGEPVQQRIDGGLQVDHEIGYRRVDIEIIDDLVVDIANSADQIVVQNYFATDGSGVIDQITFYGDTTVWDEQFIRDAVLLVGDAGDNTLTDYAANEALYGLGGNDTLTASSGDDTLIGGDGSDTYQYAAIPNHGDDRVDNTATDGATAADILNLYDVSKDLVWLSQEGDDLLVEFVGNDGRVTIEDWFNQPFTDDRVDEIHSTDGLLTESNVQQLINAMAAFEPNAPVGAGSQFGQEHHDALDSVIAAAWS